MYAGRCLYSTPHRGKQFDELVGQMNIPVDQIGNKLLQFGGKLDQTERKL